VRDRVGNVARATTGAVRLAEDVTLDVTGVGTELRPGQLTREGAAPARLGWTVRTQPSSLQLVHDVAASTDAGTTWSSLARAAAGTALDVTLALARMPSSRSALGTPRAGHRPGRSAPREAQAGGRRELLDTWSGEWQQVDKASATGGRAMRAGSAGATATYLGRGDAFGIVCQ
jgi:hypothetical protein